MDKKLFLGAPPELFDRARILRENQTPAELKLWEYLKNKPRGYKFRRQHPLYCYVADFYCHALKLIIEVDGPIHKDKQVKIYDSERQRFLENMEMRFLRFTNEAVEHQFEAVVSAIENALK